MTAATIYIILFLVLIVCGCKNNALPHTGVPDELLIGVFAGDGEDVCCRSRA